MLTRPNLGRQPDGFFGRGLGVVFRICQTCKLSSFALPSSLPVFYQGRLELTIVPD